MKRYFLIAMVALSSCVMPLQSADGHGSAANNIVVGGLGVATATVGAAVLSPYLAEMDLLDYVTVVPPSVRAVLAQYQPFGVAALCIGSLAALVGVISAYKASPGIVKKARTTLSLPVATVAGISLGTGMLVAAIGSNIGIKDYAYAAGWGGAEAVQALYIHGQHIATSGQVNMALGTILLLASYLIAP